MHRQSLYEELISYAIWRCVYCSCLQATLLSVATATEGRRWRDVEHHYFMSVRRDDAVI